MGQGRATIDIARSADEVWGIIGNFGGLSSWMPGVESCVLDGQERRISMMGMEIVERLITHDDPTRTFSYSIIGGFKVDHHVGTIQVLDADGGARIYWDVDVEPDQMVEMMTGVYQGALDALRSHLTG